MTMSNKILSHEQIQHKIKRIAYQIYETNVDEPEIIIAGIDGGGLHFAKKIQAVLQKINEANITLCKVIMDKSNPLASGVKTTVLESEYTNKSVVLLDDVLNSGTTIITEIHNILRV